MGRYRQCRHHQVGAYLDRTCGRIVRFRRLRDCVRPIGVRDDVVSAHGGTRGNCQRRLPGRGGAAAKGRHISRTQQRISGVERAVRRPVESHAGRCRRTASLVLHRVAHDHDGAWSSGCRRGQRRHNQIGPDKKQPRVRVVRLLSLEQNVIGVGLRDDVVPANRQPGRQAEGYRRRGFSTRSQRRHAVHMIEQEIAGIDGRVAGKIKLCRRRVGHPRALIACGDREGDSGAGVGSAWPEERRDHQIRLRARRRQHLCGVSALTEHVHAGHDVVIAYAVREAGVSVLRSLDVRCHQRVRAARCRAPFYTIARGTGGGGPGEPHL